MIVHSRILLFFIYITERTYDFCPKPSIQQCGNTHIQPKLVTADHAIWQLLPKYFGLISNSLFKQEFHRHFAINFWESPLTQHCIWEHFSNFLSFTARIPVKSRQRAAPEALPLPSVAEAPSRHWPLCQRECSDSARVEDVLPSGLYPERGWLLIPWATLTCLGVICFFQLLQKQNTEK